MFSSSSPSLSLSPSVFFHSFSFHSFFLCFALFSSIHSTKSYIDDEIIKGSLFGCFSSQREMTAVVKQDHATGGPQLEDKRGEDQGGPPFPAEDRPGGDDVGSEKKGPEPGEVAAAGAASTTASLLLSTGGCRTSCLSQRPCQRP